MTLAQPYPPYPWLQDVWEQLQGLRKMDRLPHAILFTGSEGIGKYDLAKAMAWSLLCKSLTESGQPCGVCSGCSLLAAGNHPDFRLIEPEEQGKAIKIDSIREFIGQESITAHAGGYKPVIIRPADAMNQNAANSLLKTLEEPVSGTIMFLVSSSPSRLPATIRSRCRTINISTPAVDVALEWLSQQLPTSDAGMLLQAAGGAPLSAVRMSDPEIAKLRDELLVEFLDVATLKKDPIIVAGRWVKQDFREILNWMCGWVIDMLRLQVDSEPPALLNPAQQTMLQEVAAEFDRKGLYQALDRIYEARSDVDSTLNKQMMLERMLLSLVKCRANTN